MDRIGSLALGRRSRPSASVATEVIGQARKAARILDQYTRVRGARHGVFTFRWKDAHLELTGRGLSVSPASGAERFGSPLRPTAAMRRS